ncbi:MAG TPA: FAD-binding protein [Humisphaera sp.]|nr:FAD-binding protein [Humisphaera sp.]
MSEREGYNWAGNFKYGAREIHRPKTLAELQSLVSGSRKIRALGSRHSFSRVADIADGDLVSLEHFKSIGIDSSRKTAEIGAGVTFAELCVALDPYRLALPNLLSLLRVTVAGACATASHGSGNSNKILAAAVVAMEIIAADGQILRVSRDDPQFDGMVVALGALGVVTKLTLALQPTFDVEQRVFDGIPVQTVFSDFAQIMSSGYSVSLFTNFADEMVQCWVKSLRANSGEVNIPAALSMATPASRQVHMLGDMPPEFCTEQLGKPGIWHWRLPHFNADDTPSSGSEIQSEFVVPMPYAVDALRSIQALGNRISKLLQISEIRTIASDTLWMSPCFHEASVAIHFTWKDDRDGVLKILPDIEAALKPFNPKAHYGKLCTDKFLTDMGSRNLQLLRFVRLMKEFDCNGKFHNEYLQTLIGGN